MNRWSVPIDNSYWREHVSFDTAVHRIIIREPVEFQCSFELSVYECDNKTTGAELFTLRLKKDEFTKLVRWFTGEDRKSLPYVLGEKKD